MKYWLPCMNNLFFRFDQLIEKILHGVKRVLGRLPDGLPRGGRMMRGIPAVRINQREFLQLFQRLSMLLMAGVSQGTAIVILCEQSSNKRQKLYLAALHTEIMKGRLLSKILADQTIVPTTFKTLISLGEQTGTLPKQMATAVRELLALRQSKQQIITSLLYPAILLVLTLSITLFLLIGIFPKITPVFSTLRTELPLSTRLLIGVSGWLSEYGLWLLLAVMVVGTALYFLLQQSKRFARVVAAVVITIPVLGCVVRLGNTIHITRMLAVLLDSGVRSSDAVELVSQHIRHPLYSAALRQVSEELVLGRKMSGLFGNYKTLFSPDMVGLIQVAEQSGSLPKTCEMIAALYTQDLDVYLKKLTTLIEPLLMIFMGLTIGFIAVSIITPLYGLTNVLSQ